MADYRIPVGVESNQSLIVALDGSLYEIRLVWNILGFWSLSIYDNNRSLLISGVKVVLGIDFLEDHPDRGLPPGRLFAWDKSGNETDIGRDDFVNARDVMLVYRRAV
jgi:hypothetical protein